MASRQLAQDPYNVIIAGVGGQGNVMASRVLANMLVKRGYYVTIGETFGASQRGGSVMSHLRVSATSSWSPQIPKGRVDVVIALEPTEGIRILKEYGNPQVTILSNTRAIRPVGVIAGEQDYPSMEEIRGSAQELASTARFIDATEEAVKLGNPVLGNVIMLGALSGLGVLPMDKEDFKEAILKSISQDKLDVNLKAYDIGRRMIEQKEDRPQHQN
jgi:indolepyruvate ferredoxin oxidoreductase beta subunit